MVSRLKVSLFHIALGQKTAKYNMPKHTLIHRGIQHSWPF